MKALVLEKKGEISLRDIDIDEQIGPTDVHVKIMAVGICGSDIHYYKEGYIGDFVVKEPMILGHEAAGVVISTGKDVTHLKAGDRVCMEPGIPSRTSKEYRLGLYNLDPGVKFWATPPVHGCLRETVVHPADFTYKLPDHISFSEGAMVEPLAIGVHAATKARISPGDVALIIGAGTIGLCTALACSAAGCSNIIITDIISEKLKIAKTIGDFITVDSLNEDINSIVDSSTSGFGADSIFETSGSSDVGLSLFKYLKPGGRVVYIGMPKAPIPIDIVSAQVKEAEVSTIFRYAHVFRRTVNLLGSKKINVLPLITDTFDYSDSVKAYEYAVNMKSSSIKVMITL